MKKHLLLLLVFLFAITLHAQQLSGVYKSSYTTYESPVNPAQNYEGEASYLIAINIKDHDSGVIAIQDTKSSKDVMNYEIKTLFSTFKIDEWYVAMYEAHDTNGPDGVGAELFLYFNREGNINLRVNQLNFRQVFHGLTGAR